MHALVNGRSRLSKIKQSGAWPLPEVDESQYLASKGQTSTFMWCSKENKAQRPSADSMVEFVLGLSNIYNQSLSFK